MFLLVASSSANAQPANVFRKGLLKRAMGAGSVPAPPRDPASSHQIALLLQLIYARKAPALIQTFYS